MYGALLGRQKGRNVELCTSFEMKMCNENSSSSSETMDDGSTSGTTTLIDLEFLNTNIGQFKQVFADLDFLGWYTTGGAPTETDVALHKQVCTVNESPLLLKLDPFGKHTDLPVSVYESIIDVASQPHSSADMQATSVVTMLFIELEFTLATEEAERIGVDHIAKHSSSHTLAKSAVADHLNAQYSAITLLNNRIRVIYEYVKAVRDNGNNKRHLAGGEATSSTAASSSSLVRNNDILREIQSLCQRLPAMGSPNFYKEFYTVTKNYKLQIIDFKTTTTM